MTRFLMVAVALAAFVAFPSEAQAFGKRCGKRSSGCSSASAGSCGGSYSYSHTSTSSGCTTGNCSTFNQFDQQQFIQPAIQGSTVIVDGQPRPVAAQTTTQQMPDMITINGITYTKQR